MDDVFASLNFIAFTVSRAPQGNTAAPVLQEPMCDGSVSRCSSLSIGVTPWSTAGFSGQLPKQPGWLAVNKLKRVRHQHGLDGKDGLGQISDDARPHDDTCQT
eukprot:TRINITY_DN19821_c0_g1_i2.p1 TRINITY_DN19821_c0_g1~~TRINITY_DN19821_c0_g1_i2.p1  ORF type:complete len:103 (-),score=10.45 TRINITY_DN19821_c0_g1_i2:53-361(-)